MGALSARKRIALRSRGMFSRRQFAMGFALVAVLLLSACDSYIEEVRVRRDGEALISAQAIVVCSDPLQAEILGDEPCDRIDRATRTGELGDLPFGFELDPDAVSIVASGEIDRRTVDASWQGPASELSSLLVNGGTVTALDDLRTEVVFRAANTPLVELMSSEDPEIQTQLRLSRWEPAEFRINVPDLIVEHNGDEIQGRIVIWELDGDHPDEFRVVWTTEDPPRRWWWIIGGFFILTGVLAMIVVLEGPKRQQPKKKPVAAGQASGTTAEDGSGN